MILLFIVTNYKILKTREGTTNHGKIANSDRWVFAYDILGNPIVRLIQVKNISKNIDW